MKRLIKFLNKGSEYIFGLAAVIYMFLSYVEKEHTKSHEFLVLSLLAFIGYHVITQTHNQEELKYVSGR